MAYPIIIKSNFNQITSKLITKLNAVKDKELILRPICFEVIDLLTKRIHIDGKDSNDTQIGTYSEGYMKLRTHSLPAKYTKGKNKGKPRVYENPKRLNDKKVIISFTRQLENQYAVKATPKGYGVGFLNTKTTGKEKNIDSFDKVEFVEKIYNKKIFNLTKKEKDYISNRITKLVNDEFNK